MQSDRFARSSRAGCRVPRLFPGAGYPYAVRQHRCPAGVCRDRDPRCCPGVLLPPWLCCDPGARESSSVPPCKASLLAPRSRHIPVRDTLLCTNTLSLSAGLLLAWGSTEDSPLITFSSVPFYIATEAV